MGCVSSRIDKEERVQNCRRRKRLMKHLLVLRGEFADAQSAYLRALKNTGVTLRQFTESESLEIDNIPYGLALPPSPPPPLPPPPPPPLSPDSRNDDDNLKNEAVREESSEINEDGGRTPSPPIPGTDWYWLFGDSSPHQQPTKCETVEQVDEDNWEETTQYFEDEGQGELVVSNTPPKKPLREELRGDNLSAMSSSTKETTDMAMTVWRSKKTLDSITKELDDYFLKASAGGKEIAVLFDINNGDSFLPQNFKENKRRRSNSPKVFSVLSWSWSSKSLQFAHGAVDLHGSGDPCRPGAHCVTLEKLYAAEQKLYKEVKEEEMTKLEHGRKSMLLQKLEDENQDWNKTEKTRLYVDKLDDDIRRLQHSISETCSSILKLIEEELYPQLVKLISGLMLMWRIMYECHQAQKQISQQLNHLTAVRNMDFTTDDQLQATAQLQNEVNTWYHSFCKLTKSQRDYVKTLCGWIELTDCLVNDRQCNWPSVIRRLCEDWKLVFDKLPEEVTSESIRNFLLAIQTIFRQQIEECNLHKKSKRLEKRLQKELNSLEKLKASFAGGDVPSNLSPKHPLSLKSEKIEALKKRVEAEKAKFLESVKLTKDITLSNLKTSLPIVFEALMAFSRESARAYKAVYSHINEATLSESQENSTN